MPAVLRHMTKSLIYKLIGLSHRWITREGLLTGDGETWFGVVVVGVGCLSVRDFPRIGGGVL